MLAAIRDSRGSMWWGTLDRLTHYDGYELRVFRHDLEDEHSLSADFVMTLYQEIDDFLWVGKAGAGQIATIRRPSSSSITATTRPISERAVAKRLQRRADMERSGGPL
jgi:ligand-binding sensor domain-containing protein